MVAAAAPGAGLEPGFLTLASTWFLPRGLRQGLRSSHDTHILEAGYFPEDAQDIPTGQLQETLGNACIF